MNSEEKDDGIGKITLVRLMSRDMYRIRFLFLQTNVIIISSY